MNKYNYKSLEEGNVVILNNSEVYICKSNFLGNIYFANILNGKKISLRKYNQVLVNFKDQDFNVRCIFPTYDDYMRKSDFFMRSNLSIPFGLLNLLKNNGINHIEYDISGNLIDSSNPINKLSSIDSLLFDFENVHDFYLDANLLTSNEWAYINSIKYKNIKKEVEKL